MVSSFVLRLVDEALEDGSIAGEIHDVETGTRVVVTNQAQLISFLLDRRRNESVATPNEVASRA